MRKLFHSILTILGTPNASPRSGASKLQLAFQQARAQRNIDIVLPVLLESNLYLVIAEHGSNSHEYYLLPSPNKERFCVTVSDDIANLSTINWPKEQVTGAELLKALPHGIEIVLVYKNGGDYITREHLEWYRSQMTRH